MKIIYFKKLVSTSNYAKENIKNLNDKDVIIAHNQTMGHGRFDRQWINFGENNIFMTFVLKPSDKIEKNYANLTQYLSVCVCEELELIGLKPKIKWPNDIMINNKKIAGILAEAVIKNKKLKGIVLGIGLNVQANNTKIKNLKIPVTALNLEGIDIRKETLIEKITKRFFDKYENLLSNGFVLIKDFYEKHAQIPEDCKISVFDKTISGNFIGFDNDGQLILKINNEIKSFNMGEFI